MIFFTHTHLTTCLLSMVNVIAVTTVLLTFTECLRRIQIIFMLLESAFHWLFCLKFSFKLATFSKSYVRKQKWVFFRNIVYNYYSSIYALYLKRVLVHDRQWTLLDYTVGAITVCSDKRLS